ncbi:MAG: hypothetical protein GW821_19230 [Shewanella vesiculosa]|uniref:DUF6641 family protein n=1 Tax=Shewanella TaxID=22 RepID=UPI000F4D35A2|nr:MULTISPECIES: DUF6641 family protein [Shewanella]NCO73585.1 hypothetical protein [Shewanella vesiculosa]NCP38743.1 hypothetical protein [Shewanella vesiculosa]NCP71586.1 hypothetical protein [Shewanella vesiculosa]NCP76431.1 hypothetical protein [Shewanella vesiculosa]NCQ40144.1 hypothetical protein [Shewanella vesiculosa]
MTTLLSSLKVIARPEIAIKPPIISKRNRLIEKLEQQLDMAECMVQGKEFEAYREKMVKDPETGERKKVRRRYNVRSWYYDNEQHYYLEVRISGKPIELVKDKPAIDVGEKAKLPDTIKIVIDAVEKGELDEFLLAPPSKFPSKKVKAKEATKPDIAAKSNTQ